MSSVPLSSSHPELAAELVDGSLGDSVSAGSGRKVWWRCAKGHEWEASVVSRAHGSGCPYCANRKVWRGYNDLATTHADVVGRLADASVATEVHAGSTRKVEWVCEKGHKYTASVRDVVQFGHGCPYCSGRAVLRGFNDLATTHPEIASEMVDSELAHELSAGSNRKVLWECGLGHRWSASVNSRCGSQRSGCPVCSGATVSVGVNDLATTHPELVRELVDAGDALAVSAGSRRRLRWRCEAGHEWEATVASRALSGTGCPYCSGRRYRAGIDDFASAFPDLAREAVCASDVAGLGPRSHKVVSWRCEAGHVWDASVDNRVRGSGCPYCSGRRAIPGETDLATLRPDLAAQLVDQSLATSLAVSSNRRVMWRCERGHEWSATPASRTSRDACGCPYCSGRLAIPGETDLATTHPGLAAQLARPGMGRRIKAGSHHKVMWRCERGHEWLATPHSRSTKGSGCPVCAGSGTSLAEQAFVECVRELAGGVEVLTHDRTLFADGRECDVLVPSVGVGFEFDGLFWHSEEQGKERSYHHDKVVDAGARGVHLVHVWEDDWRLRPDVVRRMVAAKLGRTAEVWRHLSVPDPLVSERLFARKLEVREVESSQAREFLDANHLQGRVTSSVRLGLFDGEGRLRALMCLRSPKNNARMRRGPGEWEIQRYATYGQVVGGFSRLLAHAERLLRERGEELSRWMSFSSHDVSDGGLYERCGFVAAREVAPDYRYAGRKTDWVRRPKESFQRKDFRRRDDLEWDEAWTEREAARRNGLHRIWDSGKVRWERVV